MNNIQIPCIVESGLNTCYITSLFIALFYKYNEYIYLILEDEPKKPEGFYLQELIKIKFIEPIKRNYSISFNIINEIRNYAVICGWSNNQNISEQKDCSEFYNFLADLFNISPIEFEIIEIKDNVITNNIKKKKLSFIKLNLCQDDNIKNLLSKWINSTVKTMNISHNPYSTIINCYKLNNIPQFVILNINRFDNSGKRTNYKLDIMKRIKFFEINDISQKYLKWKIHSIICHNGNTYKSGHYYSIISLCKKKWLLFDDMLIPSFQQIDLENDSIKEKIMVESVILIYTLETIN